MQHPIQLFLQEHIIQSIKYKAMQFTPLQVILFVAVVLICFYNIYNKGGKRAPTTDVQKPASSSNPASNKNKEAIDHSAIILERLNQILEKVASKQELSVEQQTKLNELKTSLNTLLHQVRSSRQIGQANQVNQVDQKVLSQIALKYASKTEGYFLKYEEILNEKLQKVNFENTQNQKLLLSKIQEKQRLIQEENRDLKNQLRQVTNKYQETKLNSASLQNGQVKWQKQKEELEQKAQRIKDLAAKFREKSQKQLSAQKQKSGQLQRQLLELKEKLSAAATNEQKFIRQNQTNQTKIAKLQDKEVKLSAERAQLKMTLKNQRELYEKERKDAQALKQNYSKIVLEKQALEKIKVEVDLEKKRLEQELQNQMKLAADSQKQVQRLISKVQALKKQKKMKEQQTASLNARLVETSSKFEEIKSNLQKEIEVSSKFKQIAEQKEKQCNELNQKYILNCRALSEQSEQSERVKKRLQETKTQLYEATKSKEQLLKENQVLCQLTQQSRNQAERFNNQLISKDEEIQQLIRQRQASSEERQRSIIIVQQAQELKRNLEIITKFDGDILQDRPQHKQYLKESIESYTGKKIFRTKKIYASEKDLNFSFHKYVDDVPDIVVLVKTVSGFYLAGYSESPVTSKAPASKGGLLVALNNRKAFPLLANKKSVTYDSFFLIIGNSEIRLKNQEWKVFSNFGIANSFFNNMGSGVNDLLGEGPAVREVAIVNFEVFKIIWS